MSHVKQLWPFTAARQRPSLGDEQSVRRNRHEWLGPIPVPPGRIGNGVPLSADEVSGHVEISDTRFDITGGIPPMRDAVATVDFRGNDVDVALSAGAVYLPDGKSVSATNGVFTIRNAQPAQSSASWRSTSLAMPRRSRSLPPMSRSTGWPAPA